jgi:hypothetical protein
MKLPRRTFLKFAGAAGAVSAGAAAPVVAPAPSLAKAQTPAPIKRRPARERLEQALARIADPGGEGARACLTVYERAARIAADAADARASAGAALDLTSSDHSGEKMIHGVPVACAGSPASVAGMRNRVIAR